MTHSSCFTTKISGSTHVFFLNTGGPTNNRHMAPFPLAKKPRYALQLASSCVAIHPHRGSSGDSATENSEVNNGKQHGSYWLSQFCTFAPPQNDGNVAHT